MNRKCEVCSSENISVFLSARSLDNLESQKYKYFKCKECGFVFLDGGFDFSVKSDIYNNSGYYSREREKFKIMIDPLMRFFNRFRYSIVSKNIHDKKRGKLLDVGCGKGKFLVEARRDGWTVFGIEPTKRSAEIAIHKYGLNVTQKYLSPELFKSNSFDVITMWHVFEHIPNPNNVLKIASRWLKDEGLIFIASPNIYSKQAQFGKEVWFNLDPPRHVNLFSPETLKLILEKNGFSVKYLSYFYPELNHFSLLQTFLNKIGCSPNFRFNFLKRNKRGLPNSSLLILRDITLSILVLFIFGLSLICLSSIEELFEKGGSLVAVAQKRNK